MEPHDVATVETAFASSLTAFTDLAGHLFDPDAERLDHAALEELIDHRGREVLRLLLQDHLDLRTIREEAAAAAGLHPLPTGTDAVTRTRREKGRQRQLATVFGLVEITRIAYRAPRAPDLHPFDAALNLPTGLHSHGLRRRCMQEAVRGSFDQVVAAVTRACGPVVAKRQARGLVAAAAVDVAAFYDHRIAAPAGDDTVLVLTFDAKGVVMVPGSLREATRKKAQAKGARVYRTRLASGEKRGRKRMAQMAAVYDAEPAVRRPHDIIRLTADEDTSGSGSGSGGGGGRRTGPRARGKWLTASLSRSAKQVVAEAFDRAEERDPHHRRTWVVLLDGDNYQIDLVTAEAKRREVEVHLVVDFVHVSEYLWRCAWCFFTSGQQEAERWVGVQLLGILSGRLEATLTAIRQQAAAAGLTGQQGKPVREAVGYLEAKRPYLDYPAALEQGWPIATGVIEGAARHLIADRMDLCGARWGLAEAEAVLVLRAVEANGDMDAYFQFHIGQELVRNHQTRYQDGYRLTA